MSPSSRLTGELEDNAPKQMTQDEHPDSRAQLQLEFPQIEAGSGVSDPPPPYRDRRYRTLLPHTRQSAQHPERRVSTSGDVLDEDGDAESETSPLLEFPRRERAVSHSSTARSTQSFAHNVISLFQAEFYPPEVENISFWTRMKRYFRPMKQLPYYVALLHLLVINFPVALAAWIYLFVATFVGAALLLALPIGALLCWLAIFGSRVLAKFEISLQTQFHGPLAHEPPNHPLLWRTMTYHQTDPENGNAVVVSERSFLRSSYAMFIDPVSYQNLFYFLVVKPAAALLIFVGLLILVPPALVLVIPFPAVLRAARKIGILQANVALESLS